MKIYIKNKQISKIDVEKPFFIGGEFADKIELFVQNNIAESYYPRLTYLLANTRKFGPFISNGSAVTTTVVGVEYKKWTFSLSTETGVLTVPGPINITIDLYYNNSLSTGYSKIEVIGNVINNVIKTNRYQQDANLVVVNGDANTIIANYNAIIQSIMDTLATKLDKNGFKSYYTDSDHFGILTNDNRVVIEYNEGTIKFGDLDSNTILQNTDGDISISQLIDLDYLFHSYFMGAVSHLPETWDNFDYSTPVGTYFFTYNNIAYRMEVSYVSSTKRVHKYFYSRISEYDSTKVVNVELTRTYTYADGVWGYGVKSGPFEDNPYIKNYDSAWNPAIEKDNDNKCIYHDVEETSNVLRTIRLFSSCLYHGFTMELQFRTSSTPKQLHWLTYSGMSSSNVKLICQGMEYNSYEDYQPSANVCVDMLFKSNGTILTIYVIEIPL